MPLPDETARKSLIQHLLLKQIQSTDTDATDTNNSTSSNSVISSIKSLSMNNSSNKGSDVLSTKQLNNIIKLSVGYSGSDLTAVCVYSECI